MSMGPRGRRPRRPSSIGCPPPGPGLIGIDAPFRLARAAKCSPLRGPCAARPTASMVTAPDPASQGNRAGSMASCRLGFLLRSSTQPSAGSRVTNPARSARLRMDPTSGPPRSRSESAITFVRRSGRPDRHVGEDVTKKMRVSSREAPRRARLHTHRARRRVAEGEPASSSASSKIHPPAYLSGPADCRQRQLAQLDTSSPASPPGSQPAGRLRPSSAFTRSKIAWSHRFPRSGVDDQSLRTTWQRPVASAPRRLRAGDPHGCRRHRRRDRA